MSSHLLIITKNYPPLICGVGDHSYVLKQQLEQRGWEVSILTQTQQQQETVWSLLDTQQHVLVPLHCNVAVAVSLATTLLHKKPTLLWQYAPHSYSKKGIPVLLAMQVAWLRWRGYWQTIFFHEVAVRTRGYGLSQMAQSILQKIIANKLNFFAQHSATSIALYRSYFIFSKPSLIPVGSNLPMAFDTTPLLPENALHFFCFTNRCSRRLLQAVVQFAAQTNKQVVLHLAGAAHKESRKLLQENIHITHADALVLQHGTLSNDTLSSLIASCSLLLQPQPLEANGQGGVSAKNGTMASAMQAGKAIISMAGDMTETTYFKHGENCWLLHKDDAQDWLNAMITIHNSEALQHTLGVAAWQTYQQYFSPDITVPAFEKLLQ